MPRRETDSTNWGGARADAGRKPTGKNTKTASFSLPAHQLMHIASIATIEGKSKSEVLSELLDEAKLTERAHQLIDKSAQAAIQAKHTEKEAL